MPEALDVLGMEEEAEEAEEASRASSNTSLAEENQQKKVALDLDPRRSFLPPPLEGQRRRLGAERGRADEGAREEVFWETLDCFW